MRWVRGAAGEMGCGCGYGYGTRDINLDEKGGWSFTVCFLVTV